jgi:hypothetical protein
VSGIVRKRGASADRFKPVRIKGIVQPNSGATFPIFVPLGFRPGRLVVKVRHSCLRIGMLQNREGVCVAFEVFNPSDFARAFILDVVPQLVVV